MKKALALASVAMLATSLTACGSSGGSGNSTAAYCASLKQDVSDLKALSNLGSAANSGSQLEKAISDFKTLGAQAPANVKSAWGTINGKMGELTKDLADAGLSLKDLQSLSSGKMPPGVSVAKLQALGKKLQTFDSNHSMETAGKTITQHAKSACHVTIG
ncbi:MAG: hypothetical protein ACRDPG_00575 [Nocardioidaceae bacterium]